MTARDRLILIGLGFVAVLGAVWILAVSPARKQASKVSGEVTSARAQLAQAQTELAEARTAQARYHTAYASLAQLGQAVPISPEVPALVYALDKASNNRKVQFASIATSGSSGGSSAPAAAASSSAASSSGGAAAATPAPFTQMPFTLTFTGSYGDLIHLLTQIERFTVQTPGGPVEVSGRLLTIESIALAGGSSGSGASSSGAGASSAASGQMTWTITASAYVLAPAAQSSGPAAAGGAQPSGSTPSSAAGGASGAGSAGAGGAGAGGTSTSTPAVVRANG